MNILPSAPVILPGEGDYSFALKLTSTSLKPAFEILSLLLLVRLLPEDYYIFLKVPLRSLGNAPDLRSYSLFPIIDQCAFFNFAEQHPMVRDPWA